MFLRAMGVAVAAPALTALIGAAQAKPEPVLELAGEDAKCYTAGTDPVTPDEPDRYCIQFHSAQKEVMRLDHKGMWYKGAYIEDAGLAHRAFLETLTQMGWKGQP